MINQTRNKIILNVLGTPLQPCCFAPVTGFYRDGMCNTGYEDQGKHLVCSLMSDDFLAFSKQAGNDLSTPRPEYEFVGLKSGDWWCLCVLRWKEAYENNCAPFIKLDSTHREALHYVTLEQLTEFAFTE